MAAARTAGSSLVKDSPSSPQAWPVPMAGTARPRLEIRSSSSPASTSVSPIGDLGDAGREVAFESHRLELRGVRRNDDAEPH
jgi:hypothetical protein